MTTTAVRHGYTPTQAVELAEAAVLLAGGQVPSWALDVYAQVAAGVLTGDEAAELIKAGLARESAR